MSWGLFAGNPFAEGVDTRVKRDDQVYGMRWPLLREERVVSFVDWYAGLAGLRHLDNRLPTVYGLEDEEIDWPFADEETVLAIGTPTRWPTRNWPSDRFNQVLRELKENHGVKIVALGRAEGGDGDNRYLERADRSYVDKLPIRGVAAVLARCHAYLGSVC